MDRHKLNSIDWYPKEVENICVSYWARSANFYFFGLRGFISSQLQTHGPLYQNLLETLNSSTGSRSELLSALKNEHLGKLPLRVWAARENQFYGSENILVRVEATDKRFRFLPDLLAPNFIRAIWYPSTVASLAAKYSMKLREALKKTSDMDDSFSRYMMYGFGQRSASSHESGLIGGAAFLQFFDHTDITGSQQWLQDFDQSHSSPSLKSFSLDHGRYLLLEKEISQNPDQFLNSVFDQFDFLSIPVDSTSLKNTEPTLRQLVRKVPSEKNLILRWDGSQLDLIIPQLIHILEEAGSAQKNTKGYLCWRPNLYLMFTNDIHLEQMQNILDIVTAKGYSVERLMFGAGTQMIQKVSRDDFGVVGKITAAFDGKSWFDVEKTSQDEPGKKGLAGRLALIKNPEQGLNPWSNSRLETSDDFPLIYEG